MRRQSFPTFQATQTQLFAEILQMHQCLGFTDLPSDPVDCHECTKCLLVLLLAQVNMADVKQGCTQSCQIADLAPDLQGLLEVVQGGVDIPLTMPL